MASKWSVVFVIFIVISGYYCQNDIEQNSCLLPDNSSGTCVMLNQCPEAKNILKDFSQSQSQNAAEYLQKIQCGKLNNMRAVCCSKPENLLTNKSNIPPEPVDPTKHKNLDLLPTSNCGTISTDKISSGEKADLFELPWMALIRYETSNGLEYLCGGSIINDRYILTAAHCIANIRVGRVHSVILGDFNITSERDCVESFGVTTCLPPKEEYFIEELIPHPEYNRHRRVNDIGLIRLNQSINFAQDHIKPICLPQTKELQNRNLTTLVAAGWGMTENKNYSDVLLKARLRVTELDECQKQYRLYQFSDNQICAKGPGTSDTCQGDSGGPLIFPSNFNGTKYVQFGIVSAGAGGCGEREARVAVYVRVQNYMTWILDNLKRDTLESENEKGSAVNHFSGLSFKLLGTMFLAVLSKHLVLRP